MRLKRIKELLDSVLPNLIVKGDNVTISGSGYFHFKDLKSLKKALYDLSKTNLFKEELNKLLSSSAFQFTTDEVKVPSSEAQILTNRITTLKEIVFSVSKALESIVKKTEGDSIFIKLPAINDFQDLTNAGDSFNKILSQTILDDEIGGHIKIETVENGSIWLEVSLGTIKAVSVIGSIAFSAALAYREYKKAGFIAETTRTRKISNDRLEALQKAHKLLLDDLIDAEAYNINNKYFEKDDPERINRIKLSIKMLSEEMVKGAEILPSTKVPIEIADLFPDMKNLPLLTSKIKEIEKGDEGQI